MPVGSIKFQRIRDTRKQLGDLSSSAFYREMDDGTIPRPIKFGERTAVHPVHEIEAIMGARMNGATPEQLRKLVADLHEKRKEYLPESMRSTSVSTEDADAS
jgi:predicted DNA-binding transcriptional regulator AlpA